MACVVQVKSKPKLCSLLQTTSQLLPVGACPRLNWAKILTMPCIEQCMLDSRQWLLSCSMCGGVVEYPVDALRSYHSYACRDYTILRTWLWGGFTRGPLNKEQLRNHVDVSFPQNSGQVEGIACTCTRGVLAMHWVDEGQPCLEAWVEVESIPVGMVYLQYPIIRHFASPLV